MVVSRVAQTRLLTDRKPKFLAEICQKLTENSKINRKYKEPKPKTGCFWPNRKPGVPVNNRVCATLQQMLNAQLRHTY
jgi:hypothetical protein